MRRSTLLIHQPLNFIMHPFASSSSRSRARSCALLLCTALTAFSTLARASEVPALVDDFSDPVRSSWGIDRIVVTDTSTGGSSQLHSTFAQGVLNAEGEIIPGRGQPGWVSLVLLLSPKGEPVDLSKYEGIRLRVRVGKGMLSITANSSEIKNFDFHSTLVARKSGDLQEVRIPFRDMKRAWSEQIPLNRATITSISLVAVDLQKGSFAYDVDEVGFY